MMALADTIELAKRREQVEAWEKGEAAVAAQLLMATHLAPPPEISEEDREALKPFVAWTTQKNTRYCPARPTTIAAFVIHLSATGATTAAVLRSLEGIARLHDLHSLPNPCATWAARTALESVTNIEPPRSWKTEEKEVFLTLPAEIKAVVGRREQSREKELRRLQNELAAIKRQNQTAPDAKPVIETQKEEVTHG